MPTSKIEAELVKATGVKPEKFKNRQAFLKKLVEAGDGLSEAKWDKLSDAAKKWLNKAVKEAQSDKRISEFADVGAVKPGAKKSKSKDEDEDDADESEDEESEEDDESEEASDDEEEEDEDEKPKKKKKKAKAKDEEDEEEEESEEDSEDDGEDESEDEESEDEEDEDEKPKKKDKKSKSKKKDEDEDEEEDSEEDGDESEEDEDGESEDEEEEDEDEKPKKKKAGKGGDDDAKPSDAKSMIKDFIIDDPDISVESIVKKLSKKGSPVSKVTVSNVRAEFRHTLKHLKKRGKLKGIEL